MAHSFPRTAESDARRASNLTPISVVAQEVRCVGQPLLDCSPKLCHRAREGTHARRAARPRVRPRWRAERGSSARGAAGTTCSRPTRSRRSDYCRSTAPGERPRRARARLRGVEQPEHVPDFTAAVNHSHREMCCTWLSVRPTPPGRGEWWPGVWLEQAPADPAALIIDALTRRSGCATRIRWLEHEMTAAGNAIPPARSSTKRPADRRSYVVRWR